MPLVQALWSQRQVNCCEFQEGVERVPELHSDSVSQTSRKKPLQNPKLSQFGAKATHHPVLRIHSQRTPKPEAQVLTLSSCACAVRPSWPAGRWAERMLFRVLLLVLSGFWSFMLPTRDCRPGYPEVDYISHHRLRRRGLVTPFVTSPLARARHNARCWAGSAEQPGFCSEEVVSAGLSVRSSGLRCPRRWGGQGEPPVVTGLGVRQPLSGGSRFMSRERACLLDERPLGYGLTDCHREVMLTRGERLPASGTVWS